VIRNFKKFHLVYISFFLITAKWISSYYFFNESIDVKIIFESVTDGKYYYPLIKYLSDFNFSNSFDPKINNLNIIPIPFSSLFLHALFLKFLNFYSFIFLEFLSLTIFLILLYKINRLIFSKKIALFFSIILLSSPIIIDLLSLSEFQILKIFQNNFYNFRVPRPMISNIFLFGFIYLLLKMIIKKFYTIKNFSLMGIILGLSLSSFYYYFFLQILSLIFLIIIKFKFNILNEIKFNFKYYLIFIITLIVTTLPFLVNLYFHEEIFTKRQCVFKLNYEYKLTLIKFYLNQFFEFKFLFVFGLISLSFMLINFSKLKIKYMIFNNVFYLIFISSIINPLFFIIISPKACVFYHFNNLIIITSLLYLFYLVSILLNEYFINTLNKISIFFCIILMIIFSYTFYEENNKKVSNQTYKDQRYDFNKIIQKIKSKKKINNTSILTFETDFMIWAIMSDVKYLTLINGLFTSKTDLMIEKDIYTAFKILNLDKENFEKFLRNDNDKSNWRYLNKNIQKFFFYKYQANSMVTFENTYDFSKEELIYINNSSPLLQQQSIIPKFEIKRLLNEYDNFNEEYDYPNYIILSKNSNFYKLDEIKIYNYCKKFDGKIFLLLEFNDNNTCGSGSK